MVDRPPGLAAVRSPQAGGRAPDTASPDRSGPRFLDRELSWLDFGERLLDLADDEDLPLLERVKFLAVFSEGLDEFFQVRVAGLEGQVAAGLGSRPASSEALSPVDLLPVIRGRVDALVTRQNDIFLHRVVPALADAGVVLSGWRTLDRDDRVHLEDVFLRQIFPVLTPLAVDPGHPFPYISNLSLNLVVEVVDPLSGERRIARVKLPPLLPRFVLMPDGERFVPLEQVIAAHLDMLFPAMRVEGHVVFRVTRDTDLSLEGDLLDDPLAAVERELHRRRFGQAVRLEISAGADPEVRDLLAAEVDVPAHGVYEIDGPLDLAGLWTVAGLDRPDLSVPPWTPVVPAELAAGDGAADLFEVIRSGDVLVHHPYESFASSVVALIEQAADDPAVLAIKQTLYRTSGDSRLIEALIRASRSGKQVAAVVEITALFDEQANITWARALEEAGVHVSYGLRGLKTHSKTSLVVREEPDGIRRYCHVGTGNYNSQTAARYEDLGILSADPELADDVGGLFNYLTGFGAPSGFRRLVVAPASLRAELLGWIGEEAAAGSEGRIVLKANGLTDPQVIEALYAASCAGTSIDLIVRNRCCVRPGVPGMSENIRVRSIVGRFLEHSRIYLFGGADGRPLRVLLGSADPMERNLDRRIEAVVPLRSPALAARLESVLELAVADDTNSWELASDGRWSRVATGTTGVNLQARLQAQALVRSRPADRDERPRVRERPVVSPLAGAPAGGVPPLVKLPIPVPERTLAAVPEPASPAPGWWSRLTSRLRGGRRPG